MYPQTGVASIASTVKATICPFDNGQTSIGPEAQIPVLLDRLDKQATEVHEALGILTSKIGGVLRPIPPCDPSGCAAAPVPPRSDVAARLDSIGDQLWHLLGRIRELSGRVDL